MIQNCTQKESRENQDKAKRYLKYVNFIRTDHNILSKFILLAAINEIFCLKQAKNAYNQTLVE